MPYTVLSFSTLSARSERPCPKSPSRDRLASGTEKMKLLGIKIWSSEAPKTTGQRDNNIGDNNDVFPTWNTEIESTLNSFSPESIGIWVPQAPTPQQNQTQIFPQNINFGRQIEFKNSKGGTSNKSRRKWRDDNSFAVPQINPSSSTSFKSQELFGRWI
ncbi:hypothetical protein RND71_027436 [Anisodus tanguticus]|uniref:Uncharacterized protein n=1 Tax=Anisodus tanguticus TaxID=243964 RepID=A0AAE1RJ90_9SOLA|nr:hypothetical protein RND71_027436 [Anisodus tanguticus]